VPPRLENGLTGTPSWVHRQLSESADKTGLKFGLSGRRASICGGDPVDGDLSLYNEDGLTIARLVLENGEYQLRTPITWPRRCHPE
jgi:hypothetical protein